MTPKLVFMVSSVLLVSFFQAEDGIRDYKVTGVQTCALPIWYQRVVRETGVLCLCRLTTQRVPNRQKSPNWLSSNKVWPPSRFKASCGKRPAKAGFLLSVKLTSRTPAPHNPLIFIKGLAMSFHSVRLLLLSAIVLTLFGCEKSTTTDQNSSGEMIVRIGASAPLTGPQAHLGKDNENGTRMAIDDANAKGTVIGGRKMHFELISEDDQADPKTATIVAQKLVDDKVSGVIGHLNSGTSIPAAKIYSDNGIPQISPSATAVAYTAQGFKTAFRVMANDAQQGRVLGEYAAKNLAAG